MIAPVLRGMLELLWPTRTTCLLCEGALGVVAPPAICGSCWTGMAFPGRGSRCSSCSRPTLGGETLCGECAQGSQFGRAWALGFHAGALREAIHHLKFNNRDELGLPLGRRLASHVDEPFEGIVPVPLHRRRLRERGYNQAALIAQGLAAELKLPVWDRALVRGRSTGHQAKLDRADRMHNLQGAFRFAGASAPWAGKAVLLVDDVLTTGATAAAAAEVLIHTGAIRVGLAVLAVSTTPVGVVRNVQIDAGNAKVKG